MAELHLPKPIVMSTPTADLHPPATGRAAMAITTVHDGSPSAAVRLDVPSRSDLG